MNGIQHISRKKTRGPGLTLLVVKVLAVFPRLVGALHHGGRYLFFCFCKQAWGHSHALTCHATSKDGVVLIFSFFVFPWRGFGSRVREQERNKGIRVYS